MPRIAIEADPYFKPSARATTLPVPHPVTQTAEHSLHPVAWVPAGIHELGLWGSSLWLHAVLPPTE